jgi:acyl dehydratase
MPVTYEPHYFEDMEEGMTFESAGRTVTEADLVMYSSVSGDWEEIHTNVEYAEGTAYGQRIAHGPFTFVITTGLTHRCGFVERTVVAFLGMNYMNCPAPVHIGDTLSATFEVTETRELNSRDDAGLVVIDAQTVKQDGTVVFEGDMKFMFKRRDA